MCGICGRVDAVTPTNWRGRGEPVVRDIDELNTELCLAGGIAIMRERRLRGRASQAARAANSSHRPRRPMIGA